MEHPGPETVSDSPPRSRDYAIYLVVGLVALLVRAVYLWEIKDSVEFWVLLNDAHSYDSWAQKIAKGDWLGTQVFYQAPFYPYFLGAVYTLLGRDLLLLRIVQVLLGTLSCMLVAGAARGFFSRRAGLLAGLLFALCPAAVYFDGLIQKAVLSIFFMALLLFVLARIVQHPRGLLWAQCGVVLGCFGLTRENSLILLPVVVVWLLGHFRHQPRATILRWGASLLLGLAVVLLPVALRNKAIGGDFILTTSQLGSNLYIGNNERSEGIYAPLRPGRSNWTFERKDATELAEEALGRTLRPAEVSQYWTHEALSYVRGRPWHWLRLMVRKWLLTWNAIEIPDTEDQYVYSRISPLLRALSTLLHFGVILPLAALGVCLTWRERRRVWLLYVTLITYAASVTAFYVFSRYRMPLVPILVLFAGAGLANLRRLMQRRAVREAAVAGILVLGTALLANREMYPEGFFYADSQFNVATRLADTGNRELAARYFRRTLQQDHQHAPAHNGLGNTLFLAGRTEEALRHFADALQLDPDYAEAHNNMGNVLVKLGRFSEAMLHYSTSLELKPQNAGVHVNMAMTALLDLHDPETATAHLRKALELTPGNAELHGHLGAALLQAGRISEAITHLREALRIRPELSAPRRDLEKALLREKH
ncbi:tetratricopeptide repeat protein [Planctomycetota bacterium]